jgi:imidazolonepropionase-like amidohydrolase
VQAQHTRPPTPLQRDSRRRSVATMMPSCGWTPRGLLHLFAVTLALLCVTGCPSKRQVAESTAPTRAVPDDTTEGSDRTDSGPPLLLRGGRVMTAAGVTYDSGDVLVSGGRIMEVGERIEAPPDARIIDVGGKTLTPGLIDTHSHIGVYAAPSLTAHGDGNEIVGPVTAYVRAEDGYWPQDPQIERARAGGVTTMQILPGSANLIGGRTFTVKTYRHARTADEARFTAAPPGLKMACGENPKRVYGEKGGPYTRMGNIAGFREAFQRATEYRSKLQRHRNKLRKHAQACEAPEACGDGTDSEEPPEPPDRNFGLETLVAVLDGEILVHNHCYRADEMSIMLDLATTYGFEIRSFHHAVEAYKIADRLAESGVAASIWADWWGFKAEAFDGIRENAAFLSAAGARAIIHSDSGIGIQRLNQEAAKAMHAGRRAGLEVSDDEALRWITVNAAWALGVDDVVGTLEAGKQADLVVWSGDPFSVYSRAEQVFIEGELVYDRSVAAAPDSDFEVGYRPSSMEGTP